MQDRDHIELMMRDFYANQMLQIDCQPIGGGDIHRSYKVSVKNRQRGLFETVFAKVCDEVHAEVLESEHASLRRLTDRYSQPYPKPIKYAAGDGVCCLVMEFQHMLNINASSTATSAGSSLANLLVSQHMVTAKAFGWHAVNYIGLTPQLNEWHADWPTFYARLRIQPQLERAKENGLSPQLVTKIAELESSIEPLFDGYSPLPALLHGDLWLGNVAYDPGRDSAVMFDPAPYFGDREADLAMTELFGTFPASFYQTYKELLPMDSGYEDRKPLYNLYHALNHFNLFGSGYETLVQQQLASVLTKISKRV